MKYLLLLVFLIGVGCTSVELGEQPYKGHIRTEDGQRIEKPDYAY